MGKNSKIEWTHHTFNPWYGCQKIAPGCDHCYAEGWAKRSGLVQWGPGAERRRTNTSNWKNPLRWDAAAARMGVRYRVFCASLADVFDNAAPTAWRVDLWCLIRRTPNLDWLIVTKRVGNVLGMLPADWGDGYPNVMILITVTNQYEADRDIPRLLSLPAAQRGLSMEPLLDEVDLSHDLTYLDHLDWVIVGGESGIKARPMNQVWVRRLRDQCEHAAVPFLFKQWGEWLPFDESDERPGNHSAHRFDDGGWSLKIGKNKAGRLLDGRQWDGYPPTTINSDGDGRHHQPRRCGTAESGDTAGGER